MENLFKIKFAKSSLFSVILTALATSVHHYYEIGIHVIFLILVFILIPTLLMLRIQNSNKKIYLWIYGFLNVWLVAGFGFIDGFWNHTLKIFDSGINSLIMSAHGSMHGIGGGATEDNLAGNHIYQGAGILTFIAALFAAYYGYNFIKEVVRSKSENH